MLSICPFGAAVTSIESPLSALVKFEVDEARAKVASGTLRLQCRQYASAVLTRSQIALQLILLHR